MKLTREKALQKIAEAALQGYTSVWGAVGRIDFGWHCGALYYVELPSRYARGNVYRRWTYKTTRGAVNHIVKLLMADAR